VRAVIIGASGLVGMALYQTFQRQGIPVVGTRNSSPSECGLIQFNLLRDHLLDHISDVNDRDTIYLLAAYSNPSWIFENQRIAEELNCIRTKALIDAVRSRRPRIIFMSSVEVFDGMTGSYREDDEARPLNFYGVLKERVEKVLCASYENHTIVRTGWNVGWNVSSRCVVKLTYETLLKDGARMARDNVFSIVDVNDTASCLAGLIHHADVRKIHVCSDESVNRAWLARRIIEKSAWGHLMGFREVDFDEIAYSERRGRLNDLVNDRSKVLLGMRYRRVQDIIDEKVALLDEHFAAPRA